MLLEAIYEQVFYACSHAFRRKKSAHQALREIRENCMGMGIRWILDADIKGYLESDARRVMEVLPKRFNRFGLTIHPTKTKLIEFGRPNRAQTSGKR